MVAKLANNASSTLASAINSSVTTVSIASGDASRFPALAAGEWFPLTVVDTSGNIEVMRVTARSGATLTVVRGQEGTTARAFAAGSKCDLRLTAAAAVAPALATDATAVTQATGNNSKAVANTEFIQGAAIRADNSQSFTQAQQGRARANMGGGVLAGHRNKLLNGAARLIQRGSRTIAAGASAYVFDRFFVTNNTNQTVTVSQATFALGSGFAREARYAMRFNFASAPTTGSLRIEQRVEFVDSIRPGDWTFIGWMSGPSGSEAVAAEFVQNFGTGGSPSAQVVTAMTAAGGSPTTIYSASTNRRAWGVTVPLLGGKLLGTNANDFAAAAIVMTPRQAGNYDLTWLSLVEGDATSEDDPFTPRDPEQEESSCQRYFEKSYNLEVAPGTVGSAGAVMKSLDGTQSFATLHFPFKTMKRAVPTCIPYSTNTGAANQMSGDAVNFSVGSTRQGRFGFACGVSGVSIAASTFLSAHFTADAEIY